VRSSRPASAVVALAVVALSSSIAISANAAPRELAPPGLSTSIAHASTSTRHGVALGVPGRATRGSRSGNGISYHYGPVMTAGVHVYLIWYGNWANDSATSILPTLVSGLSGSPYYNINTTYTNSTGARVPNSVALSGQTTDAYSQGASNLSDNQIGSVVSSAISAGRLPLDANGLYFVLTSPDVTKSGFLTQYCGWHTHGTLSGTDVKYAFVGNPGANAACSVQTSASPNGNVGADAMASIVAHELEESATDPDLNAWYDSKGNENADKCAWTFGTTYAASNGSLANMTLGGRDFLIQRNWVNASGGFCATSH
jgi:hypothetical protein